MNKLKALFLPVIFAFTAVSAYGRVYLLELDGPVNPVVADYISEGLGRDDVSAVIIRVDTPGGLMDSMRQIVRDIQAAPFPVIVYVGPSGARAASAGAFIVMASDIAVMARGTSIGSAHPVRMGSGGDGEGDSDTVQEKAAEDAAALMRGLAEKSSRNVSWAERAVYESISAASSEALEKNVIEYLTDDFVGMLEVLEGKKVFKHGVEHTLSFGEGVEEHAMSFSRRFLNHIAHPNLAYILMLLGVYGLIYEVTNPGIGFGAALGGVSLLLAMLAFQVIPINTAGLLLIILGVMLMVMDIWVPSFGVLTAGGLISFIIGSLTLYDIKEFPLDLSVSLIAGAAASTALFFVFAAGSGIRAQLKKVSTGSEGMVGLSGETRTPLEPSGEVFVRGEIWAAVSDSGFIPAGSEVTVTEVSGNRVRVKKND